MVKWKEKRGYENSRFIMASYGANQLFSQWITGAFGLFILFFYENFSIFKQHKLGRFLFNPKLNIAFY